MLTTRFWGSTTVLLCALLLQNCQSDSLRATEEEGPVAGSSSASAMRQRASSRPPATQSLAPLSASPAARASTSCSSTTPATKQPPSTAPSSGPLSPARRVLAAVGNCKALYNLQPAARPRAFHAAPLGNTPGHAPSPDGPRVSLGKVALLREMPSDEKENAKPPAKRPFTDLDDEFAKGNEKARDEERCAQGYIRRDTLNLLLCMAVSAPDKAAELLEVLLIATQDKHFRQQALEVLGKVAQASPDMFSACLPSLRAAAEEGEDKAVRLLALRTLGEVEWRHYFGEVGPIPALPSDMDTILDSACPFWPKKKVKDTHLLVLMPATVDGAPFTLNLLGELIQRPRNGGHRAEYEYYSDDVKAQFGAVSPVRSYWLLMTRDVLEGSRSAAYLDQGALVARHARRIDHPYEMPNALEAATAILMHHARMGERLFGNSNGILTYTCCQELVDGGYPVVVGGFDFSGLRIDYDFSYDHYYGGVVGCRRF